MSVAEVRKALSFMRKEWTNHSSIHPFFTCKKIGDGDDLTIALFSFRFVMGHHEKRHSKHTSA